MKHFILFFLFCIHIHLYANNLPINEFVPNRVIIELHNQYLSNKIEVSFESWRDLIRDQFGNFSCDKMITTDKINHPLSSFFIIDFSNNINMNELILFAEQNDLFKSISYDYYAYPFYITNEEYTPNDPLFNQQWSLKNDGSSGSNAIIGADAKVSQAWTKSKGDSTIVVAILDSGIKTDHPEFEGRLWNNPLEIPDDGIDNDSNKFIDDVFGWNFGDNNNDISDQYFHGTAVAGIIGANGDNAIGISGVDYLCKLMTVKIRKTTNGSFPISAIVRGINYAVDNGVHIMNMSLGTNKDVPSLEAAINYAYDNNVLCITASGNDGNMQLYYPAAYEPVLTVGATNARDERSVFSIYGSHMDLVAPGSNILVLDNESNNNYSKILNGTSFSAPLVTGIASLVLSIYPNLSVEALKNHLINSCDDQVGLQYEDTEGWDPYYGNGRINAYKALSENVMNTSLAKANHSDASYKFEYFNSVIRLKQADFTYLNDDIQIDIFNLLGEILASERTHQINLKNYNMTSDIYVINASAKNKLLVSEKLYINLKN